MELFLSFEVRFPRRPAVQVDQLLIRELHLSCFPRTLQHSETWNDEKTQEAWRKIEYFLNEIAKIRKIFLR